MPPRLRLQWQSTRSSRRSSSSCTIVRANSAPAQPRFVWSSTPALLARTWLLLLLLTFTALPLPHCSSQPASVDPTSSDANPDRCADLLTLTPHKTLSHEPSPYTGDNLVYFLHIPRTAGRTFHSCFLKLGTPAQRRCPKAYDHLRINVSVPNCFLLSSHDDFSVAALLPDNAAVLTHLRNPVDRFVSAYEFAIEIAARKLISRPSTAAKPDKTFTENVWPWSYLVPFFMQDMRQRAAGLKKKLAAAQATSTDTEQGTWALVHHPDGDKFYFNKAKQISKWNLTAEELPLLLPPLDPYNNPLAMSLEEFAQHPIARELLHNGQAFQVLGITNYSHWGDAAQMRDCMWDSPAARSHLQEVALTRLSRFFHVGVTDRLTDSVAAAGAAMHFDLGAAAHPLSPEGGSSEPPTQQQQRQREGRVRQQGGRSRVQAAQQTRQGQRRLHEAFQRRGRPQQQRGGGPKEHPKHEPDTAQAQDQAVAAEAQDGFAAETTVADAAVPSSSPPSPSVREPPRLGLEYVQCAQRAQQRSAQRRDRSLGRWTMPDGRSLRFSRARREQIPEHVLLSIVQMNQVDMVLYRRAEELLSHEIEQWSEEGRLEQLPPLPRGSETPKRGADDAPSVRFHIPKPVEDQQQSKDEL